MPRVFELMTYGFVVYSKPNAKLLDASYEKETIKITLNFIVYFDK